MGFFLCFKLCSYLSIVKLCLIFLRKEPLWINACNRISGVLLVHTTLSSNTTGENKKLLGHRAENLRLLGKWLHAIPWLMVQCKWSFGTLWIFSTCFASELRGVCGELLGQMLSSKCGSAKWHHQLFAKTQFCREPLKTKHHHRRNLLSHLSF